MEVHDFEQEHLESVLKEDDDNGDGAEPSTRDVAAQQPSDVLRILHHSQSGDENNTSKERYDLLPDYAQASFVKTTAPKEDVTNSIQQQQQQQQLLLVLPPNDEQASLLLTIQDSKEDVELDLPKDIQTPVTKRARDMVRMTATKCVSAPQLEVLLKVKQAGNHEFAFLQPNNECHAYYIWLKEQLQLQQNDDETAATKKKDKNVGDNDDNEKTEGLSLLDMYSSSSEEEESSSLPKMTTNVAKEPTKDTTIPDVLSSQQVLSTSSDITFEIPQIPCATSPPGKDDNDKRPREDNDNAAAAAAAKKAQRLKRAKLMRGHYRLQLLMGSDTTNIPNKYSKP